MLRSPVALLRELPAPVRVLVAGSFVNKAGSFILPYLTLVLRREFRLPAEQVGALVLAYGVGSIASILAGGLLTDRLGRRLTLLLSLFGGGALAVAMGVAPSIRVFVPLLLLFGFLADLYRPAASAIIGDVLPSHQRVLGYAALRMAVNLGFAFGMALGGVIADWRWRALFLGDGLTTIAYGVIVHLFIAETRPQTPGPRGDAPGGAPSEGPWRDAVFLQLTLSSFAFSIVFFLDLTVLPLTITLGAGYPAVVYGVLVGLNGLLIALFEVTIVDGLRRYRRLRVAALGMVVTGVGFAVVGLVRHWAWFLLVVVVYTAGEILSAPQKMAFLADWAPAAARGRYLGFFQATWSLAVALNPVVFLPLHARLGDEGFWLLTLPITVPPALLLLRLDRIADRPDRLRGADRGAVVEAALTTRT